MGTIARGAKLGGGTNFNTGQLRASGEVNTDFNTAYAEINGLLDDANIETATIPGAKSLRFTDISVPSAPAADQALLYGVDLVYGTPGGGTSTSRLEYRVSDGTRVSLGRLGCLVAKDLQTWLNNTQASVVWNVRQVDNGIWTAQPLTATLTCPFAGTYLFDAFFLSLGGDGSTGNVKSAWWQRSTTSPTIFLKFSRYHVAKAPVAFHVGGIGKLAASETVTLEFIQTSGTSASYQVFGRIWYLGS